MARTPALRAISMSSAVSPTYTQCSGSRRNRFSANCKGAGCGFLFFGVFAANTRGKAAGEVEIAKLAANPRATPASNDAQFEFPREQPHHATRAGEQRRIFTFVGVVPEAVGFDPFGTRQPSRAVNAQPVGRIVLRELSLRPVNSQSMKHRKIGAEVGFVGIQQGAVPIEKDCTRGELCDFHGEGIVSDGGCWDKRLRVNILGRRPVRFSGDRVRIASLTLVAAIAQREDVIAAQREIIESGGVTAPARHIHFLGAHNVRSGAHLDAPLAQRAFDERHFQLDRRARLKITGREEIDAARADIAGDQRDRNGFEMFANPRETKRQRK